MWRKLNYRDKHTTFYPERAQYFGWNVSFKSTFEIRNTVTRNPLICKSFQTDTERLQEIFMHTLLLNIFLVILKLRPRVFELLRTKKITLFQINKLMDNLIIKE